MDDIYHPYPCGPGCTICQPPARWITQTLEADARQWIDCQHWGTLQISASNHPGGPYVVKYTTKAGKT